MKRVLPPFPTFLLWTMSFGIASFGITSAQAAERIYASYGSFERSVSVKALEVYAKEGRVTGDLGIYLRYLKPERRRQFRAALQQRATLTPVSIAQFLYAPVGEQLLKRAEKVVQPKSGVGGFFALRAALILAAADPEGLTFLNLLKAYPTEGIQVDLAEGLSTFSQGRKLIQKTDQAVASIEATAEVTPPPALTAAGRSLATAGAFTSKKVSLNLEDSTPLRLDYAGKSRPFPVDVYLPQGTPGPRPVIVISHGLNSDRQSYAYLAEHLASHGFAVAVPEHTGSNTDQLLDLLAGRASEVPSATEFVDRPLDVKFLLDDLQMRSQTDPTFKDRLNLKQVGVIGQSFGGYTALALAGAPLNFNRLQQDCRQNLADTLNLSLVLQCQALRLAGRDYQLADPRIRAAITINPVGSSLFGPASMGKIQVPIMVVTGNADTIAPALPEQIRPFSWLTSPQKYLALIRKSTHFSTIDEPEEAAAEPIPTSPQIIGPSPELARTYIGALSTAFMQTHAAQQPRYQTYLSSDYAAALSQSSLPLSLIEALPEPGEGELEDQT
ncbi:hypothetical protein C1752_03961 [Acaryochloris thomasi RCC1774]|uniref:DUF1400 domain-containing protein n=1 Tax=Acaryochloris thomasi RCC1774 TaxID=1764569 RepID=A0A2W1JDY3_9CYAN|nr:alpha/beta hydrolase [Acaryochloris thomasi]PZD72023.1 hypothetical protein C1752_03961 [Acaryochloris thomasi RCC1774]